MELRPLRRVREGEHKSRDGRWTFLRHWSDPAPQRWFVFLDDDPYPANEGGGQTTLRDAFRFVEEEGDAIIEDYECE